MISVCDTSASRLSGRYFSTHGRLRPAVFDTGASTSITRVQEFVCGRFAPFSVLTIDQLLHLLRIPPLNQVLTATNTDIQCPTVSGKTHPTWPLGPEVELLATAERNGANDPHP